MYIHNNSMTILNNIFSRQVKYNVFTSNMKALFSFDCSMVYMPECMK